MNYIMQANVEELSSESLEEVYQNHDCDSPGDPSGDCDVCIRYAEVFGVPETDRDDLND